MKRIVLSALFSALAMMIHAQDSQTVFNFLRLPVSAHAAALGGDNITLADDDAAMVFHNPALLYNVSDRTLGLNMMTYMQGSFTGSASYSQTVGERGSWGVQGRFISYGEMKETTYDNQQTGTCCRSDHQVSLSAALSRKPSLLFILKLTGILADSRLRGDRKIFFPVCPDKFILHPPGQPAADAL